jgi:hypothetical protein
MNQLALTLLLSLALSLAACGSPEAGAGDDGESPGDGTLPDDPDDVRREPADGVTGPPARQVTRLTAAQLHASLAVATGQSWAPFRRYAGAMGQPDYFEVTEENVQPSVAFDKLVGDAARDTCRAAVDADVAGAGERVIMRHAGTADTDRAAFVENLKYLLFRFHAARVTDDADPRLAPWLRILESTREADMPTRWQAVCIGLVTHPDFLTY